jgi:uncharacterized OB-fold protein
MARVLGDKWLLPELDAANRAWWTSGALPVQECTDCGALQHPPEDVCHACQGTRFGVHESAGRGRIESVAIVHHPVHPALADAVPYAIVVVSLDDAPGVNAIGNVAGSPPEAISIGAPVRVVFEEVLDPESGETLRIPQWELV